MVLKRTHGSATVASAPEGPALRVRKTRRDEFINRAAANWFYSKDRKIIPERSVCPTLIAEFGLEALFESRGWQRLLNRGGRYYPRLVQLFYANAVEEDERCVINSVVKGKNISVKLSGIADYLGMVHPTEWLIQSQAVLDNKLIDQRRAKEHYMNLVVNNPEVQSRWRRFTRDKLVVTGDKLQTPLERLILAVIMHNVRPRECADLNTTDCYILRTLLDDAFYQVAYRMYLPGEIFDCMVRVLDKESSTSLVFPNFLQTMFEQAGVDFSDEQPQYPRSSMDMTAMHYFRWEKSGDQWVKRCRARPGARFAGSCGADGAGPSGADGAGPSEAQGSGEVAAPDAASTSGYNELLTRFIDLQELMTTRFDGFEEFMTRVDSRLDAFGLHLASLDSRLGSIEARQAGHDNRIAQLEASNLPRHSHPQQTP